MVKQEQARLLPELQKSKPELHLPPKDYAQKRHRVQTPKVHLAKVVEPITAPQRLRP